MKRRHSGQEVRRFILENVDKNLDSISRAAMDKFGISRQSVNRYLRGLTNEGLLASTGRTRSKKYYLKPIVEKEFQMEISDDLEEDRVWRQFLSPLFKDVKRNVLNICHYGFTEMFNNVLEHSEGKIARVRLKRTIKEIDLFVVDDGIGIFNNVAKKLGLEDPRHAILELSKGKLTTDPRRHTGEGIFFTTRMFDTFRILSETIHFAYYRNYDWLIEDKKEHHQGTAIKMQIETDSERTLKEVFDKYSGEDYGFTRTHVFVGLLTYGEENLVSRSQAKRLLARFNQFREVVLDFEGVEYIGQAFADEIFRVFKNNHPGIRITWVRANEDVSKMIDRAIRGFDGNQLYLSFE